MAKKKTSDKLKIISYKKNTFADADKIGEYTVRYNPVNIQHDYDINFDEQQAIGSSGGENKYSYSKPEKLSFELIFDQTIVADGDKEKYSVNDDIKTFKKHIIDFNGSIHRPNYVRLAWGDFTFKGQIASLAFNYTAFSWIGKPLKARATVSFLEVVDVKARLASENKSSPDLSHIITIKEGDRLPMICNEIYGDPTLYIEVARMNKLDSFRKLKAGEQIILPPLEK